MSSPPEYESYGDDISIATTTPPPELFEVDEVPQMDQGPSGHAHHAGVSAAAAQEEGTMRRSTI